MRIGARYLGNGKCDFIVWAPLLTRVELKTVWPNEQAIPMTRDELGYWRLSTNKAAPGTRYWYRLDGEIDRPDPASYLQPDGVHGPSAVVDHSTFAWTDAQWSGIPLKKMVIYELHTGTFTPEGTFDAIIPRLIDLSEMGITAVEIMPVAHFPGERNWGYDGAYPFAVHTAYGGVDGLKRLIDACHRHGLAVLLDVVYNHLGPEGTYLKDYGPYFTPKYKTPWGDAMNFDGEYSDEVRNYFVENALYWLRDFHIDALRLDAIQGIYDTSAQPFLQELAAKVDDYCRQAGRKHYLIAESDLNDARVLRPRDIGGFEIDAQWSDDFHHALHTLLTGEQQGYYVDFGAIEHLAKALREGFVYSGKYSEHRKRHHGNSCKDQPPHRLLVCTQNHDQVGNRKMGERLSTLVPFETAKLAAGALILSPYIPLIFMGEEYAEEAPFLYFVDLIAPELVQAVRSGYESELQARHRPGKASDPQSPDTFMRCKLSWELRTHGTHKIMLELYRRLITIRSRTPAFADAQRDAQEVTGSEGKRLLFQHRWHDQNHVFLAMSFNDAEAEFEANLPKGSWWKVIDSSEHNWNGPGSTLPEAISCGEQLVIRPMSFALYERQQQ